MEIDIPILRGGWDTYFFDRLGSMLEDQLNKPKRLKIVNFWQLVHVSRNLKQTPKNLSCQSFKIDILQKPHIFFREHVTLKIQAISTILPLWIKPLSCCTHLFFSDQVGVTGQEHCHEIYKFYSTLLSRKTLVLPQPLKWLYLPDQIQQLEFDSAWVDCKFAGWFPPPWFEAVVVKGI